MRRIEHPGLAQGPGVDTVASRYRVILETLPAGQTLLAAFETVMSRHGISGAVARLGAGSLFPAAYVLPALSSSAAHAVYYSEQFDCDGPMSLSQATVTVGLRQGKCWIHCHGRWHDSHGKLGCGHLLPEKTVLNADLQVELVLLQDATFEVTDDTETNFSLFKPYPLKTAIEPDKDKAVLVRLSPNVDVCEGLIQACQQHDLHHVRVLGGVGSTVGGEFDDGRHVEPFVTELMVRSGYVGQSDQGGWSVEMDITLIDYTGGVNEGRLALSRNPVLVTCELVLIPI